MKFWGWINFLELSEISYVIEKYFQLFHQTGFCPRFWVNKPGFIQRLNLLTTLHDL